MSKKYIYIGIGILIIVVIVALITIHKQKNKPDPDIENGGAINHGDNSGGCSLEDLPEADETDNTALDM